MEKPALVSLTFDDGLRCQFEEALPVLNEHGLRATFFLIANNDLTQERWEGHIDDWWKIDWEDSDVSMLKGVIQDGHEIGSHTVTHHKETMRTQPDTEASESKRLIENWLGTTVSSFSYPFYGTHDYLAEPVKRAGYKQARGGCGDSYYAIGDSGGLDRFNVDCREVSNNSNVNDWLRPGCWHVLTFHGIGDISNGWAPVTVGKFRADMSELANRRDSGDVQVLTFKAAVERLAGN